MRRMKRKPSAAVINRPANNERKEKEIAEELVTDETVAADETVAVDEVVVADEAIIEKENVELINEPAQESFESVSEELTEEAAEEEPAVEEPAEETEAEEAEDETPLEATEEECDEILEEEGSLDGSADEVEALAAEDAEETENNEEIEEVEEVEEAPAEETVEDQAEEAVETVENAIEEAEKTEEVAEETAEAEEETEAEEVIDQAIEAPETVEEVVEEAPAEAEKEEPVTEAEEAVETVENAIEEAEKTEEIAEETVENEAEEQSEPQAKPEKEGFKLTAPANLEEVLANICVKRGRKLIYRPNEILFNCTANVVGTDKDNEEGIKVKNILDEEIKQGVKLGYIDKYDGLKMSEIKEEYENDIVYEYAEQEFKRTGLVVDGDKIKVYIYDWDMKALHHVGYVAKENVDELMPYLTEREKYSFDICGLITGGKYRKVIKDEASGKVTVEKGNDGKLGMELDISVINRKD